MKTMFLNVDEIVIDGKAYKIGSEDEARERAAYITEALSWVGTPFINCADVKGPKGGVDCAMMMCRAAVDSGLRAPFDPRPYSPSWHLSRNRELFLEWLTEKLGAHEIAIDEAKPGDMLIYQVGRCFAHGAIIISDDEVIHAHANAGMCKTSLRREPLLTTVTLAGKDYPRPVKCFSVWGG